MLDVDQFQLPGFKVQVVPAYDAVAKVILFDGGIFRTWLKWSLISNEVEQFIADNREVIKNLVYNRVTFEEKVYNRVQDLKQFIDSNYPNYTPSEKLDELLRIFGKEASFDGETHEFKISKIRAGEVWRACYFRNYEEFKFYLENLRVRSLVDYDESKDGLHHFRITLDGLNRLAEVERRNDSRYCFVAMSFDTEDRAVIYENGILPALQETNFLPIIVSDSFVDSDRTINDEIIAGIKRAKFTIADFTKHKKGVYFEAGYALGRGQTVIYTCKEDHIKDAHFDTRNFQHIVWKDAEELKHKLIARIMATIIN